MQATIGGISIMAWQLFASRLVQVNERDWDVDTHTNIRQGDTLIFSAWGEIWAGVWFTGTNGPRGWNNIDNDPKFPLPSSHPFCLLGKLDTGYFYLGDYSRLDQTPNQGNLFLRINDDTPGNGNGAFTCSVQVYRDM
jgi:hypothetical protein